MDFNSRRAELAAALSRAEAAEAEVRAFREQVERKSRLAIFAGTMALAVAELLGR